MDCEFQRQLAEEAGMNESTDETWKEMYDYHLGMVDSPMPFGRFRIKMGLLDRMLLSDPDGINPSLDSRIHFLSNELGF